MSETEDDVSFFTADGCLAEMMIEVEDHKPGCDDVANSPSKDTPCDDHEVINQKDDCDSVKTVEKQSVEVEVEKREDKENFIKALDIVKNDSDIKKEENMNKEAKPTNQTFKKKRKTEFVSHGESKNKVTDMPRYPGVKKRKLEADSQDVKKEMKFVSNDKHPKRLLRNTKESNEDTVKHFKDEGSADNESESKSNVEGSMEIDERKDKHDVLRKLPFRKNRDAPDIPDLNPKVCWWNGVGEGAGVKLGDIPDLRERIKAAKSVRALYRVLFFQWPTNGQDLIAQILDFNGFPFDKSSYEYTKRQSLMKIMLDVTISNVCEILDLKKGDKQTMINNILNFLLRPYKKIDPTLEPSLQPVVLLEKIELDKFFDQIFEDVKTKKVAGTSKEKVPLKKNKGKSVESNLVTPVRTTRNSFLKRKSTRDLVSKKSGVKPKEDLTVDKHAMKETERSLSKSTSKEKLTSTARETKPKTSPTVKDVRQSSKEKKNKIEIRPESSSKPIDRTANKLKQLKRFKKKSKLLSKKKIIDKKTPVSESEKSFVDETKIKSNKEAKRKGIDKAIKEMAGEPNLGEDVRKSRESTSVSKQKDKKVLEKDSKVSSIVSTVILSDSSETESAEETKLVTAAHKSVKYTQRRKGKPLGHFPRISDCIQQANFSALQRLHILLFGASDKADNLKGNILAFGGFPFLEGSDEWKQKHFLLSLLAQNNLREYLNLLCIQYSDDDQPTMINKLMKFLAAPSETPEENKVQTIESKIPTIETEVVSSELINKSPAPIPPKGKVEVKKKVKKKEEKKLPGGNRRRKVLMSEEEARRLEASFAREQRAMARESRVLPPKSPSVASVTSSVRQLDSQMGLRQVLKPPVADPNQLNALLQTVYKRRALKAAGAVVSTPNKGEKTKLGDIENIKFLIVTGNLCDLELLHHLIFFTEAAKSRLRKNILDFDGFGFNEDSTKYQERLEFLYSLGYDVSKRISFLLGLCTLQTEIPLQDLNELIMYFLMSPCRTKQVVPITEMPTTIGSLDESHIMFKSTSDSDKGSYYQNVLRTAVAPTPKPQKSQSLASENIQTSTPLPKSGGQKAKKSFPSSLKVSPVRKVLLPSSQLPVVGAVLNKPIPANKSSISLLNSIPAVPSYSLAKMPTNVTLLNTPSNIALLSATKPSNIGTLVKLPVNSGTKVQFLNQPSKVAVLDPAAKNPVTTVSNLPGQILQRPVVFPQLSNKIEIPQPQNVVPAPLLHGSKMMMKNSSGNTPSSPQEFLVQQQTPDGQQKTFKLIRLPPNHPLAAVVGKSSVQQTAVAPQVQQQVLVTTTTPPGLVLLKNSSDLPSSVQNLQFNLQNAPDKVKASSFVSSSQPAVGVSNPDEFILPDEGESAEKSANSSDNADAEIRTPLQENPPTDEELFSSIQEIILSSNFEDITLRNVIDRVSSQFPLHDLTHRHNYMKDCVKKIIIGTS